VAGLTKGDLEALIAKLLEERFVRNPQVTIFVKEYESKKVAVSGAVKKPDTYEMLGEKTLLEMISKAGGLDKDLGKEIIIFRQDADGSTRRLGVNLDKLVYEADPSLNLVVEPGDIIYVPSVEKVRIFVSGAVKSPNLYEVPRAEPVTVLKAITLAGGTTDRASEKKVQIIRTGDDGARKTILVNLKKIKKGKAEDPVLQKDDLVLVPEAFF
jgi:polysaccharide export outer membrane protein